MNKKYIPAIFILIILGIISVVAINNENSVERDIEKNRFKVLVRITKATQKRTSSSVDYSFFYKGKEFNSSEFPEIRASKNLEGKFFEAFISTKNPLHSRIQWDSEVIDSVRIRNAGFK